MPQRLRLVALAWLLAGIGGGAVARADDGAPEARSARASIHMAGTRYAPGVRSLDELRFYRLVRQQWDVSCGAAALSTILTYDYGLNYTEYQVATWILRGVDPRRVRSRGGFSLLDLKRFATAAGLKAEGFAGMSLEEVLARGEPAILPVRIRELDHFVVLRGAVGDRVLIGDPAFGNLTLSRRRLQSLWKSGIAFFVSAPGRPRLVEVDDFAEELRIPDMPAVARLLRGAGPAPLTRKHPTAR